VTGDQDGLEIYGGFESGDAFIDRSPTDHPVVLSGDLNSDDGPDADGDGIPDSGREENAYHVLVFDGGGDLDLIGGISLPVAANVTPITLLDGLIVTGGNADGDDSNRVGGGLYCDGQASGNACSPTLRGITFTGNTASGNFAVRGGAIYNNGFSGGESSPIIVGSTFTHNSVFAQASTLVSGEGGAIYNAGEGSNPQITSCTFIRNSASDIGGAIFNGGNSPQINGSVFTDNSAREGGAIYIELGSPRITGSTFTGNTSDFEGGAIFNAGSSPQIIGSIFAGNSAISGGAVFNRRGSPQIIGSSFTRNAAAFGGAIYINGFLEESSPQIVNTILWDNTASDEGNEIYNFGSGSNPTLAHTLIEGGLGGISENFESSTTDGGNNIDADPLFANASNPDGPDNIPGTADDGLRLLPGSPALDAGDNSALPPDIADLDGDGDTTEPIPFDITGADRIRDNNPDTPPTVDLGAYEAPADVVIPVELLGLTATATGTQAIALTWTTASETGNAGFAIEQRRVSSSGGMWRDVAFVAGAGTRTEVQTYRYRIGSVDYGRHAFRLRQVDLDGTTTLSEAVEIDVTLAGAYALSAYPNPVVSGQPAKINVTVRETQTVTVAVFDVLGRQVKTLFDGEMAASQAKTLRFLGSGLASGTYFVRVIGERFTTTERITVIR